MKSLDYAEIDKVKPLYLILDNVDGYITEESNTWLLLLQAKTKKY